MSDCFTGEIRLFAGSFAPTNWLLCNGQEIAISTYQALYSLIGTTYGGSGVTTFNVPDFRGRVPISFGQGTGLSSHVIGEKTGQAVVALTVAQLPLHRHNLMAALTAATTKTPSNTVYYATVTNSASNEGLYINATATEKTAKVMSSTAMSYTGNGATHENLMPSLGLNFIICWNGYYPPRP